MSANTVAADTTSEYVLERTQREYERLRAQARLWARSTRSVLAAVGLGPGAKCLDAGCGPGETMRLMADLVGSTGTVVGLDSDAALAMTTDAALTAEGRPQCRVKVADLAADADIPGAPYDLVFARLLLFHVHDQVAVVSRLWTAVAPGGHLVVQDYDLNPINCEPPLGSLAEVADILTGAFVSLGCDVRAGVRLPGLFADAGVGTPDGTDVSGRIEPVRIGHILLDQTLRSVLPAAVARGVADGDRAEKALAALRSDAIRFPEHIMTWPLMIGAWKRKVPPG
jgi:ubiquinone/menaquinone biosynthesis C-methylase UbiE